MAMGAQPSGGADMSKKGEHRSGEQHVRAVRKQAEALRLRAQGRTLDQIAQELGYRSRSGALKAITTALAQTITPGVEHLRAIEAERLDLVIATAWEGWTRSLERSVREVTERVTATKSTVDRARIERVDAPGDVRYLAIIVRASEARARLLGLGVPEKIDLTVQLREAAAARGLDPEAVIAAAQAIVREHAL